MLRFSFVSVTVIMDILGVAITVHVCALVLDANIIPGLGSYDVATEDDSEDILRG